MKCFIVFMSLLASAILSEVPIDPHIEFEAILKDSGFSMLNDDTKQGISVIVDDVIESSPKLKEKIAKIDENGTLSPEDRQELMALFKQAYQANEPKYRTQSRAVLKNVTRGVYQSIKARIVAAWNRVKEFFKKAWKKVTTKIESIRGKRLVSLLAVGILMFIFGAWMVFVLLKALGPETSPDGYEYIYVTED